MPDTLILVCSCSGVGWFVKVLDAGNWSGTLVALPQATCWRRNLIVVLMSVIDVKVCVIFTKDGDVYEPFIGKTVAWIALQLEEFGLVPSLN